MEKLSCVVQTNLQGNDLKFDPWYEFYFLVVRVACKKDIKRENFDPSYLQRLKECTLTLLHVKTITVL